MIALFYSSIVCILAPSASVLNWYIHLAHGNAFHVDILMQRCQALDHVTALLISCSPVSPSSFPRELPSTFLPHIQL